MNIDDPLMPDELRRSFGNGRSTKDTLPLVREAQAGSEEAFNELFERFQEPLRRIVSVRLGPQVRNGAMIDSLDVVQETFAAAHQNIASFEVRSEQGVVAWLARIAERRILDAFDYGTALKRDVSRSKRIADMGLSSVFQLRSEDLDPAEAAAIAEQRDFIDTCVRDLPEKYREVVLLRCYAGADWKTIVKETGAQSVTAAQSTYGRAQAALTHVLSKLDGRHE